MPCPLPPRHVLARRPARRRSRRRVYFRTAASLLLKNQEQDDHLQLQQDHENLSSSSEISSEDALSWAGESDHRVDEKERRQTYLTANEMRRQERLLRCGLGSRSCPLCGGLAAPQRSKDEDDVVSALVTASAESAQVQRRFTRQRLPQLERCSMSEFFLADHKLAQVEGEPSQDVLQEDPPRGESNEDGETDEAREADEDDERAPERLADMVLALVVFAPGLLFQDREVQEVIEEIIERRSSLVVRSFPSRPQVGHSNDVSRLDRDPETGVRIRIAYSLDVDFIRNFETGEVDCPLHDNQAGREHWATIVADLERHLPERILEALQRLRGVGGGGLLAWSGRPPLASHDPEGRDVASAGEVSATSFAKELSGQESCRRQQEVGVGGEPLGPNNGGGAGAGRGRGHGPTSSGGATSSREWARVNLGQVLFREVPSLRRAMTGWALEQNNSEGNLPDRVFELLAKTTAPRSALVRYNDGGAASRSPNKGSTEAALADHQDAADSASRIAFPELVLTLVTRIRTDTSQKLTIVQGKRGRYMDRRARSISSAPSGGGQEARERASSLAAGSQEAREASTPRSTDSSDDEESGDSDWEDNRFPSCSRNDQLDPDAKKIMGAAEILLEAALGHFWWKAERKPEPLSLSAGTSPPSSSTARGPSWALELRAEYLEAQRLHRQLAYY
ncbi:unnamed protein product [Amoebophrya sp. A25]|nr:unnamed protein product [Amoebophrya sp. A25]|eukprot:GSA25T00023493001.1